MSAILNYLNKNDKNNIDISWYINFKIKKYVQIDDVSNIINLIDDKIMGEDQIFGTHIIINICQSPNTQYDYICTTNIYCSKNDVTNFLDYKFKQVENIIKFYNDEYGFDWHVDYELENFYK